VTPQAPYGWEVRSTLTSMRDFVTSRLSVMRGFKSQKAAQEYADAVDGYRPGQATHDIRPSEAPSMPRMPQTPFRPAWARRMS
jgi:hypothetical protein